MSCHKREKQIVQASIKQNEVTGDTREQESRLFHINLQSQKWAVLKRIWEKLDWLTHQGDQRLDWSAGLE